MVTQNPNEDLDVDEITEVPKMLSTRSVLFVPSNVPRFVEKAAKTDADIMCLDLEDSVPPDNKKDGRANAAAAIDRLKDHPFAICVRTNAEDTGLLEDDLVEVVREGLDYIMPSMVESVAQVQQLGSYLRILEAARGLTPGGIQLIPLIETAAGILQSPSICKADARVKAAAFGGEDYRRDVGLTRTPSSEEISWARSHFVASCAAADIPAIDAAEVEYDDVDYLENEMSLSKQRGFSGKLCIHPNQIHVANRMFLPSENEIREAREIIEAFEREGLAKGTAAIAWQGRVIDTVHYKTARRLLLRASSNETELAN